MSKDTFISCLFLLFMFITTSILALVERNKYYHNGSFYVLIGENSIVVPEGKIDSIKTEGYTIYKFNKEGIEINETK